MMHTHRLRKHANQTNMGHRPLDARRFNLNPPMN